MPRSLSLLRFLRSRLLTTPILSTLTLLTLILSAGSSRSSFAGDLSFRRHDVNRESTFPAAAAIDVDQDGNLDIVSGGWWYAAPQWNKKFLRDVPEIRGRYDDYSNLPFDVNGDGRLDLISANYRSESIFWIENPGAGIGRDAWPTHRVATPGPMETARLYDIDGDERLDLLPAGVKFSAWWSIGPVAKTDDERWSRHDLPPQVTGHGIGFGDIDGDGRGDIVGVNGWAKAPQNRRDGRWEWQPEFVLHRDASVPILVHDVDGDGDSDLVWGRGHRTGLYWMEQIPAQRGEGEAASVEGRRWRQHTIDTEWSQLHSLLLADLDNDGRAEVIAAKRYWGHDGRDVGESDPMVVVAYQFDAEQRTWNRTILDWGTRAGFDLDPKAVDLDADGDIDLLCPTRGGLCWLENLLVDDGDDSSALRDSQSTHDPRQAHNPQQAIAYPDHTDLSVVRTSEGDEREIRSRDDWGRRRAHILANMQLPMGPLPGPELRVPLDPQFIDEPVDAGTYSRQKVMFSVAPGEQVIAWLLRPHDADARRAAMLCLHPTYKLAKDEVAGLGGRPSRQYGRELAERGFVCLVPDYPSFGEDHFDFESNPERWGSGSMKAIWNNIRSIDFLETLPDVDPDRIGAIGHSLGGHNALFTAAFDQRIAAVVTSCGFTEFHTYYGGNLKGWTSLRYMPRIASEYGNNPDRVPFDFQEVLAAIAPRPIFINAPLEDSNFDIGGVRAVVEAVEPVYELMRSRKRQRVTLITPEGGHDFPTAMREQSYDWLGEVLK